MTILINILKDALTQSHGFLESLHAKDGYFFREAYPVAVVHHEKRVKEEEVLNCLRNEGYLNADGYTPNVYDEEMLLELGTCAPNYVKKVCVMCFKSEVEKVYTFKEKLPGDYWKKVVDPGNFKAVIEYLEYEGNEDICKIEFDLRELMRSSKEVPSLKVLPYVWIAKVSKGTDISKIMQHYYGENFELIEGETETVAIGWYSTLQEVNMRYFVCPPA